MTWSRATAWLEQSRNDDGSWGFHPGQEGRGEPTVLALAAGLSPSLSWLEAADLGYAGLLLPAVLHGAPNARPLCETLLDELLAYEAVTVELDPELVGHDGMLQGWSWVDGTAPWVEPSSYALISLKRWGRADHPRVREAEALLLNRQCADGGWNYGNPLVFQKSMESYLPPTGWACLALGDARSDAGRRALERGLERLLDARQQASTLTLSMAILARVLRGAPVDELVARLAERQATDGSFGGRADLTALAAVALRAHEEGTHVFAVPS